MRRLHGFPPIADRRARVLILGSMPSEASLAANEYYAFRHNQFWRIAGEITGVPRDAPYARRTAALRRCRIALWDVVASCVRPGSLDSAIREDSIRVNDFAAFLATSSGLVVSLAGVVSQDVFDGSVRSFRVSAVLCTLVPLAFALLSEPEGLVSSVGTVFVVAASSLTPVILLGVWWPGLTARGAIAGMVTGALSCGVALVATPRPQNSCPTQ